MMKPGLGRPGQDAEVDTGAADGPEGEPREYWFARGPRLAIPQSMGVGAGRETRDFRLARS